MFAIFMVEKLVGPQCVQVVGKREQKPLLRFSSPHQLVVFLVKDPPSLLPVVWSYGQVLQWQKKVLAASHFIVEPTTCQSQRIFMKENQTWHIFYRLVSQTSCSILKCLVSVHKVLGCTVCFKLINRTSDIITCKRWKHLPFYTYSRSIFRRHISWKVLKIALRCLQI